MHRFRNLRFRFAIGSQRMYDVYQISGDRRRAQPVSGFAGLDPRLLPAVLREAVYLNI
jgi:hypothetical protein